MAKDALPVCIDKPTTDDSDTVSAGNVAGFIEINVWKEAKKP